MRRIKKTYAVSLKGLREPTLFGSLGACAQINLAGRPRHVVEGVLVVGGVFTTTHRARWHLAADLIIYRLIAQALRPVAKATHGLAAVVDCVLGIALVSCFCTLAACQDFAHTSGASNGLDGCLT